MSAFAPGTPESRFCSPGRGNEKGGVEGLVGFARRNFLVPFPAGKTSRASTTDCWKRYCLRLPQDKRHRTGTARCGKENPHPPSPASLRQRTDRSGEGDKYATVMVDKNRYSVPASYAGRLAQAILTVDEVAVYSGESGSPFTEECSTTRPSMRPSHYLNSSGNGSELSGTPGPFGMEKDMERLRIPFWNGFGNGREKTGE